MVGCHDGYIAGNYFHEPVASGVQAKGGSSDILIHANVFADIPGRAVNAGGSTGLEFFRPLDAPHEATRIHVVGNVFLRNGAMSGTNIAYVGCDECVFAQNTIVEPRTWVARILQENRAERFVPSRKGVFVNNIIVMRQAEVRAIANVGRGRLRRRSCSGRTFGMRWIRARIGRGRCWGMGFRRRRDRWCSATRCWRIGKG